MAAIRHAGVVWVLPTAGLFGLLLLSVAGTACSPQATGDPIEAPIIEAADVQVSIAAGASVLEDHRFSSVGGYRDGPADQALFQSPVGLAFDAEGNLYIADAGNHVIRMLSIDGQVTTVAGSGEEGVADGPALEAQFRTPVAVALGPDGSLYVVDAGADMIRRLTPGGMVETVAGVDYVACGDIPKEGKAGVPTPTTCPGFGEERYRDGSPGQSVLQEPASAIVAGDGTVYFTDAGNLRVRYIAPDGTVGTLAGNGVRSLTDGQGARAHFLGPTDIAMGSDDHLYVTDGVVVRRISRDGLVETIAGDPGDRGGSYTDGPTAEATFEGLAGLVVGPSGTVCVVDRQRIRRIADGQVSTLAGTGEQGFELGSGSVATFSAPADVAVGPGGAVYVTDINHRLVLRITANGGLCA